MVKLDMQNTPGLVQLMMWRLLLPFFIGLLESFSL